MSYTFEQLEAKLTGRCKLRRKLANHTYLYRQGPDILTIRLHHTDILTYYRNGLIRYNSGGWLTVTTKARMNEYGPLRIGQDRGQWYVYSGPPSWEKLGLYRDGITVSGMVVEGMEPLSEFQERVKLRRRVNEYARKYIAALESGNEESAFCKVCSVVEEGKSRVELIANKHGHILDHIQHGVYPNELIIRAMQVMPSSPAMKMAVDEWMYPKGTNIFAVEYVRKQLRRCLARFLYRLMGQAS